jgi:hypothetical protein
MVNYHHELAHHPQHSSEFLHVPGCTLKCSCGLWKGKPLFETNYNSKSNKTSPNTVQENQIPASTNIFH